VVRSERGITDEVGWRGSVQSSVSCYHGVQLQNSTLILTWERSIQFIPILPVQSTTFNEDIIQEYKVGDER